MTMTAAERLRERIRTLMELRGLNQSDLAAAFGCTQATISRKLGAKQGIHLDDLDRLAAILNVTVPELFFDEYGQWDRRSKTDRRKTERRQQQRQTIYDPKLEITPETSRLSFPPTADVDE